MKERWYWVLALLVFASIGVAAKGYTAKLATNPLPAMAQDTVVLDRRLNMLEQRFYSLESRFNRVEQQMSMLQRVVPAPSPTPTSPMRDPATDFLRTEADSMKLRIAELECAILRLDERTLSPVTRETRRRAGLQPKDQCRLNSDVQVKLSARP